jgi:hypothetical protein
MLKELIKLANELDNRGLVKEADVLDDIIKKEAGSIAGLCLTLFATLIACGEMPPTDGYVDFSFEDPGGVGIKTKLVLPENVDYIMEMTMVNEVPHDTIQYIFAFHDILADDPYNTTNQTADILKISFIGEKIPVKRVESPGAAKYIAEIDGKEVSIPYESFMKVEGGTDITQGSQAEGGGYVFRWNEEPEYWSAEMYE